MGILAAQVVAPHLKKGHHVSAKDFMPDFLPKQVMKTNDLAEFFKGLTIKMGGEVK